MAELAAAASAITVASFALQLADGIKKLHDFWNSIKEAPEDIRALSSDLRLLSSALTRIAHEKQRYEPDETLVNALSGCCARVKTLTTLVEEIEPGFASTSSRVRKWTAIKAVFKQGKLTRFQEGLERLKSTLLMAQLEYNSRLSRDQHNSVEQSLETITRNVSILSVQESQGPNSSLRTTISEIHSDHTAFRAEDWNATDLCVAKSTPRQSDLLFDPSDYPNISSGTWRRQKSSKRILTNEESTTHFMLGTIHTKSKTRLEISNDEDDPTHYGGANQYEHESIYTIYPAKWLIWLGMRCGLRLGFVSSQIQGWKNTLNTFRPVPDNALIFEFCRDGNLAAVRSLLSGGHASVRDTDSEGYTPLHYAARGYHPDLCKFLKTAGADINVLTYSAETPMEAAVRNDTFDTITYARPLDVADTFRLLADSIDFMDGSGWEILIDICPVSPGPREALLLWMLRLSSSDMKTYGKKENYALLWVIMTIGGYTGLVEATRLLLCLGGPELINTPFFNRASYTVLHVHAMYCASKENMSLVPAHGPDIHRLGFADFYSPEEESPFSLVLYSSWAFKDWLDALFTVEKDFEEFVTEEFRRNHTRHPGWEKETLLALSTYEYLTDYMPQQPWKCDDCTKTIFYIRVQPHWRHFLERIKQGIYPYDSAEASSEVDEEGSEEDGSIAGTASNAGAPADLDDTYSEVDEEGSKDDEGIGGAVNNTDDPADLDEISSDMGHDPESASDSVSESKPGFSRLSELDTGDPHGYHSTVSLQSECVYCPHEAICMSCWLFYVRTGTRRCGRRRPFSCSECDE